MKCPKCGFQSFNHLTACKKCGRDLADLQEKLGFDQSRIQGSAVPGRQPETEPRPNDMVRDDPALEGSLQDFFKSLEEPSGDTLPDEEDPFAETAHPPVDHLEPEDSPFDPANDTFDFEEEADDEDLLFSFDEMEGGLGEAQSPQKDDEREETGDEPFVLSDSPIEEDEPELKLGTGDFSAAAPKTEVKESSEDADFFSFADLDAELESVEESDQDLILAGGDETAETLTEESFASGFVSPREIEKAMAEDALSKARESTAPLRTELEQGEFPFADGMQQEVSFREEAESPPRSVLGLRILAILTDAGILSVIFAAFLLAGEMVRLPDRADWFRFTPDAILDLATPYFLVLFTLCFAYFTLFHFLTGQTPGKMLWRVRVEGEAGTPLSLAQAFLRTAGGLLALLPAGLGFLSIVINRQRRGWNDRLANSRVVLAGPERS